MKKTIVIFSNPFGYGPTGKAIAIAESFIRNGHLSIIFAGSSFVKEIVPKGISFADIDERDEGKIISLLKQIDDPVVISSQNRFAIRAAISLGIPTAFLDGLAWFWKNIPSDHLIADEIFWMNYPNIEEKRGKGKRMDKIHVVPAIIDIKTSVKEKIQILIHVGGCKNPLTETLPKYYLDILIESLINSDATDMVVTGGVEAIEYLRPRLSETGGKIRLASLEHNEFITELSRSKHFITTAGQTATLEAFALNIPTSFLMPMNLSQLALTEILDQHNAAPQALFWKSYWPEETNHALLNEKDAITEFSKYAKGIYKDNKRRERLESDIGRMIINTPDQRGQKEFIKYLGKNGADKIVDILTKKWDVK